MIPSRRAITVTAALGLIAGAAALAPLPSGLRLVLVAPLALALSGYALTAALFPGRSLDLAARWLLAGTLSIAVTIIAGLSLNTAGIRLETLPWALTLSGLTLVACAVAERRRPAPDAEPVARVRQPGRRRGVAPALMGAFALGILVVSMVLVRVPLSSSVAQGYTSLWLVPDANDPSRLALGVESHEASTTDYRLTLVVEGRRTVDRSLALMPGERVEVDYLVPFTRTGATIQARLYTDDAPGRVYRSVRMTVPRADINGGTPSPEGPLDEKRT